VTKREMVPKMLLATKYRTSPILDGLVPKRKDRWVAPIRRTSSSPEPSLSLEGFSFLDYPNETLKALRELGRIEGEALSARLHFDDNFCLDAGAYLVLAEIWPAMAKIFGGGRMKRPVQKVLDAIGVGHHNRMQFPAIHNDPEFLINGRHADVWAFPLQRRRPALSSQSEGVHLEPQTREKASDRFCEAVNDWLGVPEIDRELTTNGKGWIAGIIGELLCNAERHSQAGSDDGDWSVAGFMVKRSDGEEGGEEVYRCFLAFLSVGRSFAESLGDAAADVSAILNDYISTHWQSAQSPETLATVFALQDMVTCDPEARRSETGGTGLMEVLDMVGMLGGTKHPGREPKVTIVSGRSCIMLREPYMRGVRRTGPRDPRVQWCNAENDRSLPPDSNVVFDLEEHFAGTLVSVAFTLDPDYLARESEEDHGSDD
jgi:hypothetical protein